MRNIDHNIITQDSLGQPELTGRAGHPELSCFPVTLEHWLMGEGSSD